MPDEMFASARRFTVEEQVTLPVVGAAVVAAVVVDELPDAADAPLMVT